MKTAERVKQQRSAKEKYKILKENLEKTLGREKETGERGEERDREIER
jgi:hypothetical protein